MQRRQFLRTASVAAGAGLLARMRPARAQSLAGKQIRLIVPFPAGGPTDIVARPLGQMLGEAVKATVLVDNRAGAGGSVGAEAVARSAPDGQTLLMATVGTHAINPALYKYLSYDAEKDFTASAGDLIRLPMNIPHGIFNKTDQPVKCFFWVTPTRKLYDLFWAIHSMKEQKPDEVVALAARYEVMFLPPPPA